MRREKTQGDRAFHQDMTGWPTDVSFSGSALSLYRFLAPKSQCYITFDPRLGMIHHHPQKAPDVR
jgi:hypothetical protein